MNKRERKILRFEYWKLLVAQSANIDEFGEKNYNIDQRILQMQNIFFELCLGVPEYDDMDDMIKHQTWRFNIDKTGARYYTYINQDGRRGDAKTHTPEDLRQFIRDNCIR